MSLTLYSSTKVLDAAFGGTGIISAGVANYYLGLHTGTAPAFSAPTMSEPSGGSYARVIIPNNKTNWSATGSTGLLTNLLPISFAESSASWGTITYVFLADALTGGNVWWFEALSPSKVVDTLTTVLFATGAITVQFNNS
jgi:hypothetical protein